MNVPEPGHTRFDLHGRLFGVSIRINPLFWASSALLGIRYYAEPEVGSLWYFFLWMAAALGSVLLHALAQALVGRRFGMQGEVVLYGLGGLILGTHTLDRRGQRLAVFVAGPLIQLLVVAAIWGVTCLPFPQALSGRGWEAGIANGMAILLWTNYYWALLNLLPIWPLDGGRLACEVSEAYCERRRHPPDRGGNVGMAISVLASGLLAVALTVELSYHLEFLYDPRYLLFLGHYSILLVFCFLFWGRSVQALWPATPASAR